MSRQEALETLTEPHRLPNISCKIDYEPGRLRGCCNQIFGMWMFYVPREILNGTAACLCCVTNEENKTCEKSSKVEIHGPGAEVYKEVLEYRHTKVLEALSRHFH